MRLPLNNLTVLSLLCALGMSMTGALGTESFEQAKRGKFTSLQTEYGPLSCADGVAEIGGTGKTGNSSLRMFGGKDAELKLDLKDVPTTEVRLSAWAERWTGQAPFEFSITAVGSQGEKEIYDGKNIKTGGFKTKIEARVPAGTRSLVFKLTAPENKGLKLDDLFIVPSIPMKVDPRVEMSAPVAPVIKRIPGNPVLSVNVKTEGCLNPVSLNAVNLDFSGTARLADIESVTVVRGGEKPGLQGAVTFPEDPAQVLGTVRISGGMKPRISVRGNLELEPGDNHLWVCVTMKDGASLDGKVVVRPASVVAGNKLMKVADAAPVAQRIGVAVVKPGDFNSKFYRIPGLVRTKKGTLLAVYDIRYNHSGDLPANIDVGVSRSTDGGRTWSDVKIAVDDSKIDPARKDAKGVGAPAIVLDEKNGRGWVAAIWSYRHSIWGSKSGDNSPETCGQLVLASSDDDGLTWSKPVNITEQTKDKDWRILFNGPGNGICMKDGTLVFAAQYWDGKGVPWSTIVYSKDQGKTWHCGTGVSQQTTEAQVIELKDGSIMINARCNWGGSRVVGVTRDLGRTWEKHPTSRTAQLREPVCQGSLLAVDAVPGAGKLVLFSNPNTTSGRSHMTLKASVDDASSWLEDKWLLYDERGCWGYSCLAPVDKNHIGVLYEGRGALNFLKIPYKDVLNAGGGH
ncbi:BNR-repeat neuraminidase N-terminal domain-containing protein [Akkermansia sp.]|uniref:BNR-repeat neuraminidase N-terminal domain-containing protein n=1 Tax=Akkermansia sp. TaxID=1872421 RepID=UPI00399197DA